MTYKNQRYKERYFQDLQTLLVGQVTLCAYICCTHHVDSKDQQACWDGDSLHPAHSQGTS